MKLQEIYGQCARRDFLLVSAYGISLDLGQTFGTGIHYPLPYHSTD